MPKKLLDLASLAGARAQNLARAPLSAAFARVAMDETAEEATVYIYGDIGGWLGAVSAEDVAREIAGLDVTTLHIRLNSPGGLVFDGVAIYNAIAQHKAKVVVSIEGIAASIASVIAMAGDEIRIGEAASIMIHKPWSFAMGDAETIRKEADVLDVLEGCLIDIYAARTETDAAELKTMLAAETWLRGQEAVDAGFADLLIPAKKKEKPAQSALLALYRHTPVDLMPAGEERPEVREFERLLRDGERHSNTNAKRIAALAASVFTPKRDVSAPGPRDEDDPQAIETARSAELAAFIRQFK